MRRGEIFVADLGEPVGHGEVLLRRLLARDTRVGAPSASAPPQLRRTQTWGSRNPAQCWTIRSAWPGVKWVMHASSV